MTFPIKYEAEVLAHTWHRINPTPPERTRRAAIATMSCPRCGADAGDRCRIMHPGPLRGATHPTIRRSRVEAWHAEGMPTPSEGP